MYSEGIGNPLTNSSKSVGNFSKCHIFVIWIPVPSDHLPEGTDYYHLEHLDEKCFVKKKKCNLFGISLKNLNAKVEIQLSVLRIIEGPSSLVSIQLYLL
jgi:hypothetical protein